MRLNLLQIFLVSLGMGLITAPAQREESFVLQTQLSDKRQQFEEALAKATAPLDRSFISQLRQFERQAADAEDYAQAIVYRDRRLALTEKLQRYHPKRTANAITLSLTEASLTGAVTLQRGMLKGWRTSATAATWNLRGMNPGTYEVLLTYSCTTATEEKTASNDKKVILRAGGQFSFGESTRLLNATQQPLVHKVLPTADWDTYREVSLGELTVSNAAVGLRLDVIESKPLGLMQLKQVQLLPKAAPTEIKPLPKAADLQRSFESAVNRRKQRLHAAYVEDLKTLQQRAKAMGNQPLAQAIHRAIDSASTH